MFLLPFRHLNMSGLGTWGGAWEPASLGSRRQGAEGCVTAKDGRTRIASSSCACSEVVPVLAKFRTALRTLPSFPPPPFPSPHRLLLSQLSSCGQPRCLKLYRNRSDPRSFSQLVSFRRNDDKGCPQKRKLSCNTWPSFISITPQRRVLHSPKCCSCPAEPSQHAVSDGGLIACSPLQPELPQVHPNLAARSTDPIMVSWLPPFHRKRLREWLFHAVGLCSHLRGFLNVAIGGLGNPRCGFDST